CLITAGRQQLEAVMERSGCARERILTVWLGDSDNDAVRLASFGRRAEVDATQRQQTARRLVGIWAQQIAAALQQAQLQALTPVAAIGELQPREGDEIEDPIRCEIDRCGSGELVFEGSEQLLVQRRRRRIGEFCRQLTKL